MQKSSMFGFCYFTEGELQTFALHPPYGKNQKVDRFIKRLQRKIKLFLDIYLLRFSSFPGRVNVPADFDTIGKAFSGVKAAEKGIKQGLSRSNADFGSPCFCFIQLQISAVPEFDRIVGCKPCGVLVWII